MKKKSVFRKIAFLLTIALIVNLGVFDSIKIKTKAASQITLTSQSGDYTLTSGNTYVVSDHVTIGGNLLVEEGAQLTINTGVNLSVEKDLNIYGSVENNGNLLVTDSSLGFIHIRNTGSLRNNSYGTIYVSNTWWSNRIQNWGIVVHTGSGNNDTCENHGDGIYICHGEYCNTSNIVLTFTGTKSFYQNDEQNVYLDSVTVTAPSGWKLSKDKNTVMDSFVISTTETNAAYYLYNTSTGYYSEENTYSVTIKNYASFPSTGSRYSVTDSEGTGFKSYYKGYARLTPPSSDYTAIEVWDSSTYISSGSSVTLNSTKNGITFRLKDKDNQWTSGFTNIGKVVVLGDSYEIDGNLVTRGSQKYYISDVSINAKNNYKIKLSTDTSNTTGSTSISITETKNNVQLLVKGPSDTDWVGPLSLGDIVIKRNADMPSTPYTISCTDGKTGSQSFYEGNVTVTPASGYKLAVLDRNGNYIAGSATAGVTNYTFTSTVRGASIYLFDQDGLRTTSSVELPDINIISGSYEVEGLLTETEDFPHGCYINNATIKGLNGYKVCLASDSTRTDHDNIVISESTEDVKIYVRDAGNNDTLWFGPIDLGDINIKSSAIMPDKPYTLSGTKYKDKYYQSDVVLTPAEGYKVTTSKDKDPVASIKFTKTSKNVRIYLVDRYGLFTEEIKVGDIYVLREGEGKVTVNDLFYGGKVIPTVETKTNDVKKVSYKYKNASGGDYLKEVPSEVGKYVVEATFEMTEDYKELVVKDEFEISYLPTPANPYSLEGIKGENEFFTTDVKIVPADGYRISTTIKTGYTDSIGLDKNGDLGYVYLQKISTGEMTDKIAIKEIKIDKDLPLVTGIGNNEVIYTDSKQIIVKDDNLEEVSVNGVKVAVSGGQAVIDLSANNGITDYTIVMTDKAGNTSTIYVTLITAWMKEGNIQEGVPLKLYPGYTYNFPEGSTWTIDGDPTVYKGGNKFVVTGNVEIKFKKN